MTKRTKIVVIGYLIAALGLTAFYTYVQYQNFKSSQETPVKYLENDEEFIARITAGAKQNARLPQQEKDAIAFINLAQTTTALPDLALHLNELALAHGALLAAFIFLWLAFAYASTASLLHKRTIFLFLAWFFGAPIYGWVFGAQYEGIEEVLKIAIVPPLFVLIALCIYRKINR